MVCRQAHSNIITAEIMLLTDLVVAGAAIGVEEHLKVVVVVNHRVVFCQRGPAPDAVFHNIQQAWAAVSVNTISGALPNSLQRRCSRHRGETLPVLQSAVWDTRNLAKQKTCIDWHFSQYAEYWLRFKKANTKRRLAMNAW